MRLAIIIAICTASTLGGALWYGIYTRLPEIPMDHISQLSAEEYQQGELRAQDAITRRSPRLNSLLQTQDLKPGAPVFIRIFKESKELEIWIQNEIDGKFQYLHTWEIAAMSGHLGPKLAEGDRQAPEGFYYVAQTQMKPDSAYHLAFNIGYPNSYDRAHQRTGSFIMVHGNRVSAGCFAMTDYWIEEIYTLCAQALKGGQPYFRVHIFPFRMTDERLAQETQSKWYNFWKNLQQGYHWFEQKKTPPNVTVQDKLYQFSE